MQPKNLAERVALAGKFVEDSDYALPVVVDHMDDGAEALYASWPERLYVIDEGGLVALKGGVGPTFFDPEVVDDWLDAHRAEKRAARVRERELTRPGAQ